MSNPPFRQLFAAITPPLVAICLTGGSAVADTVDLKINYAASVSGIPVGKAKVEARLIDSNYSISGSGKVSGISALFSDGKGSINVTGKWQDQVFKPVRYSQIIVEDKKETLDMTFSGARVTKITMTPVKKKRANKKPKKKKRLTAIPVTEQHKEGVIDPLSVFLLPTPELNGDSVCNRTLPLFDGEQRFDVVMTFDREARREDTTVFVCALAYRPIAGHKPGKKSVKFMVNNKRMEVWLAPVGATGFVAPVEAHVMTRIGMLVVKATNFNIR